MQFEFLKAVALKTGNDAARPFEVAGDFTATLYAFSQRREYSNARKPYYMHITCLALIGGAFCSGRPGR